jgi:hypothetical protein
VEDGGIYVKFVVVTKLRKSPISPMYFHLCVFKQELHCRYLIFR